MPRYLAEIRCDDDHELSMPYCKRGHATLCDTSLRTFVSVLLCVRSILRHIIWRKSAMNRIMSNHISAAPGDESRAALL